MLSLSAGATVHKEQNDMCGMLRRFGEPSVRAIGNANTEHGDSVVARALYPSYSLLAWHIRITPHMCSHAAPLSLKLLALQIALQVSQERFCR